MRSLAGGGDATDESLAEKLGDDDAKVLANLAPGEKLILLNVLKLGEVRVGDGFLQAQAVHQVGHEAHGPGQLRDLGPVRVRRIGRARCRTGPSSALWL